MLLRIETDNKGRHIDDLFANANMPLSDENTSMVDCLGISELVDQGLQATFQKVLRLESEHVIELHARLVEHTDTNETANKRITLKKAFGILLVKGKKLTSRRIITSDVEANNKGDSWVKLRQTELHDGSLRESAGLAKPLACSLGHIAQSISTRSHCGCWVSFSDRHTTWAETSSGSVAGDFKLTVALPRKAGGEFEMFWSVLGYMKVSKNAHVYVVERSKYHVQRHLDNSILIECCWRDEFVEELMRKKIVKGGCT